MEKAKKIGIVSAFALGLLASSFSVPTNAEAYPACEPHHTDCPSDPWNY